MLSLQETPVPDVGGSVVLPLPTWVHIDNSSNVTCALNGLQLTWAIRADPIVTNVATGVEPFSQTRYGVLCLLPSFLNTSNHDSFNITPVINGRALDSSFPIRIFGISNFVSPIVTFSDGKAIFTINVYNFFTLSKQQTLSPYCRFRLVPAGNQSLPWYQSSAMRDPNRCVFKFPKICSADLGW